MELNLVHKKTDSAILKIAKHPGSNELRIWLGRERCFQKLTPIILWHARKTRMDISDRVPC